MTRLPLPAALLALLVLAPTRADAHIRLTYPPPRTELQKTANCGDTTTPRSATPTVLSPGATITVAWDETIGHPGHYRISFDADGQDFTIPLDFNDTSQNANVLVDLIPDATGTTSYTQQVTLPDLECENCTLQIIQMMTDKPPYGDGNDIYFQCADVVLRAAGGPDAGGDPAAPDAGDDDPGITPNPNPATGGCRAVGGSGASPGMFMLMLAVLCAVRRVRTHAPR